LESSAAPCGSSSHGAGVLRTKEMAELAIWIASFVAVGWLSILCAYAIGMILLLPVTGVAWVVGNTFPRVKVHLQPVGDVASRFRPASRDFRAPKIARRNNYFRVCDILRRLLGFTSVPTPRGASTNFGSHL
jgi:hypothetical protein